MDHQQQQLVPPHVLIFPFPIQGHINSMLKLSELLLLAGLRITFLTSNHALDRLLRHSNTQSHFGQYADLFRFETIPDGLPDDHPRSGDNKVMELLISIKATAKPLLRDLLLRSGSGDPVTCIIADGVSSFALEVAEEIGIPIIYFRTSSTCNFWALFCIPNMIEAGELPFQGNNLDTPIRSVPGMDTILRRRDLPSFCRDEDLSNLQIIVNETRRSPEAQGLILNTFEELEEPILAQIRSQCPKVYAIGPLHAHLKTKLKTPIASNSLWEENKSCMMWLNSQPSKSVIYVSFGSITMVTKDQLMEFWHGLINSGKRFLWVIRPDSLVEKGQIPAELLEGTMERGYMVGWAPQEQVLAHQAIGGFLTHSGWNSTLESIVEGVPMICWPYFADQQITSRFVEKIWKIGLDIKDTCDRVIIEKVVRDLMDVRREEFMQSADRMATLAREAIGQGGSSYCNLDSLISDIRSMSIQTPT